MRFDFMPANPATQLPLTDNRAFQYGDGLFETIVCPGGIPRFLADHHSRLTQGMEALGMEGAGDLSLETLGSEIARSLPAKNADAKVKVQVWRREGGLYTPENNGFHILVSAVPYTPSILTGDCEAGMCDSVRLAFTPVSRFKTCNALPYVLAGLEKKRKGLDEIVLLSQEGFLSECVSSNLFWVKDSTVYTPHLKAGCVAGVGRKQVKAALRENGYAVKTILARPVALQEADCAFATNVNGIRHFTSLGNKSFARFNPVDGFFST